MDIRRCIHRDLRELGDLCFFFQEVDEYLELLSRRR